jgi:hypothetical protein
MSKHLREQVDSDSEFLKEPTQVLEWLHSLGGEKLESLLAALQSHDKEKIAALTGLSEDQAIEAFRAWKEKAALIAKKYPTLDSLRKHEH